MRMGAANSRVTLADLRRARVSPGQCNVRRGGKREGEQTLD
jgi:hypothetical protein